MSGSDDIREWAKRLGIRIPGAEALEKHLSGRREWRARGVGPSGPSSSDSGGAPRLPADTPAGAWDAKIAAHFERLAGVRTHEQSVFALEHGLSDQELEVVTTFVRSEASVPANQRHWLLWVVHAAELGYDFDGDYWPRFARDTPGWEDSNTSRGWIREIFRWFATEFGGPRPTGAWGATFSIIAWPITNALLPRDLQRHLARALYEVQSGLVQHLSGASDLGQYIASNCWIRSDRFAQLTDQPLLLGQIAMALLQPQAVGQETILRATLDRVAADLERERQAATWLRSARTTVEQSHVRGGGRPYTGAATLTPEERLDAAARATAPQLILVPKATDGWSVRLRLPFVAPLLEVSPEIRAQVAGSRASVPAARNRWLATGQLLYPDQVVDLGRWPTEWEPLLQFDGLSRGLESALLTRWAMTPGPWLFAIRRNGTGSEIPSRRLRSGGSYLVAVREEDGVVLSNLNLVPLKVDCADVLVARIDMPDQLERDWSEALRREGLSPVRELIVWPAGLLAAEWDGEAHIRWLSRDPPMLGLRANHSVQNLLISLDERPHEDIGDVDATHTLFVSLQGIGSGEHRLAVSYDVDDESVIGLFSIEISEPRLNQDESTGPVVVWTEPFTRNLELVWDGQSVVRADGVKADGVVCTLTLGHGLSDRTQKVVRGLRLPLQGDQWRRLLRDSIQSDQRIQAKYPEAKWAQVVLDAGAFGTYILEFERELPPVRWTMEEAKDGYQLELRNDMEGSLPREVWYATFNHPDAWLPVSFDGDSVRILAGAAGGLYRASVGERGSMVVVPPLLRTLDSFDALSVSPALARRPRRSDALCELVETTRLWSSGRLPGDIRAKVWRSQIVRLLQGDLFSLICGGEWRACERALERERGEKAYRALQNLVVRTPADRLTVAGALVAQWREFTMMRNEERVERFAALARRASERVSVRWQVLQRRHGDATATWLAEFCLRAASDPHLDTWAEDGLLDAISILLDWPLLARTARCLVTASLAGGREAEYPPLFPNWEWSLV
jgi:hypothetical protein